MILMKNFQLQMKFHNSYNIKIYRMFLQVHLLYRQLKQKYKYICRIRNDVILKANFKKSIENI